MHKVTKANISAGFIIVTPRDDKWKMKNGLVFGKNAK